MLSPLHAGLTDLFRHRPALAVEVVRSIFGLDLPAHDRARLGSAEVAAMRPSELRADAVVFLEAATIQMAVVVEIQLRPDEAKRWVWPEYVASVRRRSQCPTILLVVCPDGATARWASVPIELGPPDSVLTPLVLGPDRIPRVLEAADAAATPEPGSPRRGAQRSRTRHDSRLLRHRATQSLGNSRTRRRDCCRCVRRRLMDRGRSLQVLACVPVRPGGGRCTGS